MSEILKYINKAVQRETLTLEEATRAFQIILAGGALPSQIVAFIVALETKGANIDEILGAINVFRTKSNFILAPNNTIDICNIGPHTNNFLNIYTAVAFVVAGCGIPVAKHGSNIITQLDNYNIPSSIIRASDILPILGVNINAHPKKSAQSLLEANICFMLISKYHTYLREILSLVNELDIHTIFDFIIPLCNPAKPKYCLIGVHSKEIAEKLAMIMQHMEYNKAWIVSSHNVLASLTLTGEAYVIEITNKNTKSFTITPEEYQLPIMENLDEIKGGDMFFNAKKLLELLQGQKNTYRDIVLLNAAAALFIVGEVSNIKDGILLASNSLDSGQAYKSLQNLIAISSI
ncbi:Anthranilate synthase component II [Rickettsiales bacterium Ac37b]|nr:Anthranilate synthase component II [Rickettsiales bacterium Ac37b]